jgi:uncharacterized membrane protein (DUF4010 family)
MTLLLSSPEARLALALAVGLLIGTERERRRAAQPFGGFAGLRTFGLVGFLGGLLGYTGSMALAVAGAVIVGLAALTAYAVNRDDPDRGMTTELALVVTYGLGYVALHQPAVSAAAAVVITSMLALRGDMHRFVRETLTQDELRDGLLFLVFALVVLPAAPDVRWGPYGAVNPQSLTRLVVVLMFLNGLAHMAQRLVGPRHGLAIMGFFGGFVSSSATIAALSMKAREQPEHWRGPVAGALASSVATVLQYVFLVSVVDGSLLGVLLAPLSCAGLAALLGTGLFAWRADGERQGSPDSGRPFRLIAALGFALVFVTVSIAAAALHARIGSSGIVVVSSVASLVDAHSTAASVASLHHDGALDADTAELAIVAALSANTLTKVVLAWSGRHARYGASVTAGVLAIAGAAWLGLFLG